MDNAGTAWFTINYAAHVSTLSSPCTADKMAAAELLVFTNAADMRAWSRQQRLAGKRIGFVPTMGYLHDGHLSLVKAARERADVVVASIYVNPTQFAAHEDFDVYPRDEVNDRCKLLEAGCDVVFEPASLYTGGGSGSQEGSNVVGCETAHPDSHETFMQVLRLTLPLCGGSRPHFFRGVTTVVTKLFHIVEPDLAVFGRKDYQQWRVICRMVRDLDFAVEVVGMPIIREANGLAMSSRNARLTPEARAKCVAIYQALQWACQVSKGGSITDPLTISATVSTRIEAAGGHIDYVQLVDANNLSTITDVSQQPTLLAVAAFFAAKDHGTVRLIDNVVLDNDGSVC